MGHKHASHDHSFLQPVTDIASLGLDGTVTMILRMHCRNSDLPVNPGRNMLVRRFQLARSQPEVQPGAFPVLGLGDGAYRYGAEMGKAVIIYPEVEEQVQFMGFD